MTLPVAQPAYILRGHASQIHATEFIRSNRRLVTADADGWVVVWSLVVKRPVAVWRAHEGSILGVKSWGDNLLTHGKDNKLLVWKFSEADEASLSTVLPVDTPPEPRRQPWLLHILHVNTLNFCSFSQCPASPETGNEAAEELLVAVPNTMSSENVDIFHLPSEKRIHTVPTPTSFKGGMVMAISLFHHPTSNSLTVVVGFESGHTAVSQLSSSTWKTIYTSQPHLQPILSLSVSPNLTSNELFYLTSSADALIAKHPMPSSSVNTIGPLLPLKTISTKHAGQQSLRIRNDGKIFATAGWDSRVRVYGVKGLKQLAVLKWHKEGCYAVAFADVEIPLPEDAAGEVQDVIEDGKEKENGKEVVRAGRDLTVKEKREQAAVNTHWLAVGSKDGKVSLWDIY